MIIRTIYWDLGIHHLKHSVNRQVRKVKYMMDKKKKQRIIKKYGTHANDTGSAEVQIAILTEEVKELTDHLKTHRKDFSSRRGLLKKVNQRRRLLRFLEKDNKDSFVELVKKLKIKIKESVTASLAEDEVEADTEEVATEEQTGAK